MFGRKNDNSSSAINYNLMRSIVKINNYEGISGFQEVEFSTKNSYLHIRYNTDFLHYFYTVSGNPSTEYDGEFDILTLIQQINYLRNSIEDMFRTSKLKKSLLTKAVDSAIQNFNCYFEECLNPLPSSLDENEIEEIFSLVSQKTDPSFIQTLENMDNSFNYDYLEEIFEDDDENATNKDTFLHNLVERVFFSDNAPIIDDEPTCSDSNDLSKPESILEDEFANNEKDEYFEFTDCYSEFVLTIILFAVFLGMVAAVIWSLFYIFSVLKSALY